MRHPTTWRDWRRWIPAECPGCGRRLPGQGLCGACSAALVPDRSRPRCPVCTHPLIVGVCPDCPPGAPACDRVIAAFDYAGLGRDLIQDYKIRCRLSLAGVLAERLTLAVREAGFPDSGAPDWVVPVPARRAALSRRGFSPPAEVARLLARRLGLRYRLDGVHRLRDGPKQAALGRADRLQAQTGLYGCVPAGGGWRGIVPWRPGDRTHGAAGLAGARIAVVDDVLTTGATMRAVAMALKAAGAVRVEGWVLARTVRQETPRKAEIL